MNVAAPRNTEEGQQKEIVTLPSTRIERVTSS